MTAKSGTKPLLRGYLHQEAFFTALGACALLIAKSSHQLSTLASLVYSLGLLLLLGVSAFYHRPYWQPRARAIIKRIDHSAIFILIAGTFTPVCLLALPKEQGHPLLIVVWAAATVGILQACLWTTAPKWLKALFYIGLGWLALPYLGELNTSLGSINLLLLAVGGVAYTLGAFVYALKKPRLAPSTFGYHELFHLLTIVGATLHFIVVYHLIT